MITIQQIKTELKFDRSDRRLELADMLDSKKELQKKVLRKKAAKILGVRMTDVAEITILKHSLDARKKPQIFQVYTLGVSLQSKDLEEKVVKRCRNKNIAVYAPKQYQFPQSGGAELTQRPIIIGMGPAGLFCGYQQIGRASCRERVCLYV